MTNANEPLDVPDRHEAEAGHNRRVIGGCLFAAALGLSLLWLTRHVPDWLAIPYLLAWATLAGIGYVCFVSRWIARMAGRARLKEVRGRGREAGAAQGKPSWTVGLQFAVAAAIAVLTLAMIRVAGYRADPQETIVLGQTSLFADSTAAFRILVRDHAKSQPLSGARVRLTLEGQGVREVLGEFTTGPDGSLSDPIHVPAVDPGPYGLIIESRSPIGADHIVKSIQVKRDSRVYVTTDKSAYQPGQTIHMRAMALDSVSRKPVTGQAVLFEVFDSKGNKVFKAEPAASQYGIAFCDFDLGDDVNLGDYQIHVAAGEVASARTVEVSRYVLPKFKVEVATDKPFYLPSETVRGEVKAAYFFGKPVAGAEIKVTGRIPGDRPFEVFHIAGATNAEGRFEFDAGLGERFTEVDGNERRRGNPNLEIAVTVKDGAGHEERALEQRPVSPESIRIYVFPEGGDFLEGVDNLVYLMTAYPNGRPAACDIGVNEESLRSDETGIAVLTVKPDGHTLTLKIRAQDAAGLAGTRDVEIPAWPGNNDLLLRTDKAVYQAGETARVTILSRGSSSFFLDVLRNGQTVLTRTVQTNDQGRGELAIDLPDDLSGTLRLKAYGGVKYSGRIDMDTRVIHVRPADELRIAASLDQPVYRPGATARARLQVTDRTGIPVPAALSLAAVDEAVFYMCPNQPGMLDQFFVADRRLPLKGYRIAFAVSPDKLLSGQEKYQNLAKALFSASAQTLGWAFAGEEAYRSYDYVNNSDYSLLTESYSEKEAKAAVFRNQHFGFPLTLLALATVLVIPLGVLALSSHSMFRVFRQVAADVQAQEPVHFPQGARRSVWLSTLGVLLPTVTCLIAILLLFTDPTYYHRHHRFWFGIHPLVLSFMVVALSSLAVTGFPAIYRFRVGDLRRFRTATAKGLALLSAGGVLVFAIQGAATSSLIKAFELQGAYAVISFAVPAIPLLISLVLCAIANVTSAKTPGRFYAELGKSGYVVLVILLSLVLTLSAWIFGSLMRSSRQIFNRAPRWSVQRLDVRSDTGSGLAYLDNYDDDIGEGYMGGMGGQGPAASRRGRAFGRLPEPPRVRKHFPETLLWQPQIITDEKGRADVDVSLADSITTWKMNVDAVSTGGKLGNGTVDLPVFQDFFVDLDLPATLTRSDEISIPVLCYNYLQEPQTIRLTLEASRWYEPLGPASQEVTLGSREAGSVSFRIKATQVGTHELAVLAQSPSTGDAVRRSVAIRPDGREVEDLHSAVLARSALHTFEVPPEAIPHSLKLLLKVYPSAFSEVLEGLESIFRMPHGCFEQTSSATYPNIMALLYMRHTGQATPEVEAKAREYIAPGYQRLLTFEIDGGGFDWFGQPPADEKVTAYGILELSDMSKVHEVDLAVIRRATEWLWDRQDSDGSWGNSGRRRADSGGQSSVADTAYIAWALAESGVQTRGFPRALDFLRDNLHDEDAPYTIALAANALLARDANDPFAQKLLAALQARLPAQDLAGYSGPEDVGAMYSRGLCLDIETTALAAMAMMKVNPHADMVHKALTWISEQKDRYGTWHSTQATVLAMKALIAGTRRADIGEEPTRIEVTVNDQPAGSLDITAQTRDLLHVLDLTAWLKSGTNRIRLAQGQGVELPYRLVGTYWTPLTAPQVAAAGELGIEVRYDKDHCGVNDPVTCYVQVLNNGPKPLNMAVIEMCLPPGFAVESSVFDRLVGSGVFARYEMAVGRVILYVRSMAAQGRLRFNYELRPLHPMRVQVPPSCAYEYYQPGNRAQTEPFELVVQ